eukprot:jgi/Galph1/5656/GphlegSOOS_G4285.1
MATRIDEQMTWVFLSGYTRPSGSTVVTNNVFISQGSRRACCKSPFLVKKVKDYCFTRKKPLPKSFQFKAKQALPDEEDLTTGYYWEQIAHTYNLLQHIQKLPNDRDVLYLIRFSLDQFYGVQSFLFIYLRDKSLWIADKRPSPGLALILQQSTRLLPRYLARELVKMTADEIYYKRLKSDEEEALAKLAKDRAFLLITSIHTPEMIKEVEDLLSAVKKQGGRYKELIAIYELDSEQLEATEVILTKLLRHLEYYRETQE